MGFYMPPLNTFRRGCIAVAVSQAFALPALASSININSLADTSGASSICTLRDAIISANTDTAIGGCTSGRGSDTINVPADLARQTLSLTSELPAVTSSITVDGAGSNLTISGENQHRIISVDGGELTLTNKLRLVNGSAFDSGGAVALLKGSLTMNAVSLVGNSANEDGGGIFSNPGSTVIISDTTLSNNVANQYGGGVFSLGKVGIIDSVLSNNSASLGGGGVSSASGAVTISSSTLLGNSANDGGGVLSAFSSVIISNSTLSNNTAANSGGGIISGGVTTISNATFSKNSAASGGGIRFLGETEGAVFALVNSIVSGSSSNSDGPKKGLDVHVSGVDEFRSEGNLFGSNQLSSSEALSGFSPSKSDIVATSDKFNIQIEQIIEPLASNGGSTFTHALPPDSPAVDNGVNANCEAKDQRGESRLLDDDRCDVGAFESDFQGQF